MISFSKGSFHMGILRLKANDNQRSYSEYCIKFLICSIHCRFNKSQLLKKGLNSLFSEESKLQIETEVNGETHHV
jgi:hypothetical protein